MDKKSGLTITLIFKAQSLNYGEGIGNIAELKKINRGNGSINTYVSRQALRYDIIRLGNKMYNWNIQTIDSKNGMIQFDEKMSIKDSEEMDLFGYMKTKKGSNDQSGGVDTRHSVVRISSAISLEEYRNDIDFLTNKGMADRINSFANLASIEQHLSFYTYTITIDLDKVGIDKNIVLDNTIRANRIIQLLQIIKVLNRNIKGRDENLNPVFAIGGIYNISNPFFLGRIKLIPSDTGFSIDTNMLKDVLNMKLFESSIKKDTQVGTISNIFINTDNIKEELKIKTTNIEEFFDYIIKNVNKYYKEG